MKKLKKLKNKLKKIRINKEIKNKNKKTYSFASYPWQTEIPAMICSDRSVSPKYLVTKFAPIENPTQTILVFGNLLRMSTTIKW